MNELKTIGTVLLVYLFVVSVAYLFIYLNSSTYNADECSESATLLDDNSYEDYQTCMMISNHPYPSCHCLSQVRLAPPR